MSYRAEERLTYIGFILFGQFMDNPKLHGYFKRNV